MLALDTLHELITPTGQAALAAAAHLPLTDASLLPDLQRLRKEFRADLVAAAVETIRLRRRARTKFSRADEMFFTREALEQASGAIVAGHRAQRYLAAPTAIYDVCCSIGGDALALAEAGLHVEGIDREPLRVAMAELNAQTYDVAGCTDFRVADALAWTPPVGAAIFFDPARRVDRGGARQRVWRPDDYTPPLSIVERWLDRAVGIGVKVAPGIDYDALQYDCEVEIVSVAGDVKEACLWFGSLKRHTRTATLLHPQRAPAVLHEHSVQPVPVSTPRRFVYEPDGAVIRAHLVEQLAHQLDAVKIDEEIAFVTSDTFVQTPFARAFEVIETLLFNLKRLRARLRDLDVGQVVVKKRGSPIDPQQLEQQLRLHGNQSLTLLLTRVQGQPSVILCRPAP